MSVGLCMLTCHDVTANRDLLTLLPADTTEDGGVSGETGSPREAWELEEVSDKTSKLDS